MSFEHLGPGPPISKTFLHLCRPLSVPSPVSTVPCQYRPLSVVPCQYCPLSDRPLSVPYPVSIPSPVATVSVIPSVPSVISTVLVNTVPCQTVVCQCRPLSVRTVPCQFIPLSTVPYHVMPSVPSPVRLTVPSLVSVPSTVSTLPCQQYRPMSECRYRPLSLISAVPCQYRPLSQYRPPSVDISRHQRLRRRRTR